MSYVIVLNGAYIKCLKIVKFSETILQHPTNIWIKAHFSHIICSNKIETFLRITSDE
jgi:hypothetical protein